VGIGTAIRHRLGRWEIPAAEVYRSRFIYLDDLATTVTSLTTAKRILEIGCGDGSFGQRLCAVFPDAEYLGIDIAPAPGRLYRGDPQQAEFRTMSASDLVAEGPPPFDLVVFVDVLHHIPQPGRVPILADAATMTTPTGLIAIKEWERSRGMSHLACYAADRYVTGDRNVDFATREELRSMVGDGLPGFEVVCEARIPPRRNNMFLALRRPA
jgi:2-polyprenyl-6-hydroxyphenyl methylase/3-demethylubiquinone-9 3-methyltransferase